MQNRITKNHGSHYNMSQYWTTLAAEVNLKMAYSITLFKTKLLNITANSLLAEKLIPHLVQVCSNFLQCHRTHLEDLGTYNWTPVFLCNSRNTILPSDVCKGGKEKQRQSRPLNSLIASSNQNETIILNHYCFFCWITNIVLNSKLQKENFSQHLLKSKRPVS